MTHPFSAEFIRMSKAAEEIQAMRAGGLKTGDYADCDLLGVFIWPLPADAEEGDRHDTDPWLPRLDQLMGVLGEEVGFWHSIQVFDNRRALDYPAYSNFMDWHELALAIVMREKFGKSWDTKEEKWVKT